MLGLTRSIALRTAHRVSPDNKAGETFLSTRLSRRYATAAISDEYPATL